ncbi:hypothetical protein [Aquibacillus sediminis]|uniref:hypothetical protein n=1 Tax=Aquibacillus sediminis TaxID=2574734 RepID=UPI001107C195|nr:hypothetical protein [Aquibacillus sediminis]
MHYPHHYVSHHHQHMYELCKMHMHANVVAKLNDGTEINGIITGLDQKNVYLSVPNVGYEPIERGAPPFGYGYPYPWGYGPGAGFRRLVLPLTALVALSALPWY